jgi:ribosomal protein S6E (S10)
MSKGLLLEMYDEGRERGSEGRRPRRQLARGSMVSQYLLQFVTICYKQDHNRDNKSNYIKLVIQYTV